MQDHETQLGVVAPTVVPITNIEALRRAGIEYPATVDAWRWAYRRRHENGLADAIKKKNGRIVVDVPAYLEAIRSAPAP